MKKWAPVMIVGIAATMSGTLIGCSLLKTGLEFGTLSDVIIAIGTVITAASIFYAAKQIRMTRADNAIKTLTEFYNFAIEKRRIDDKYIFIPSGIVLSEYTNEELKNELAGDPEKTAALQFHVNMWGTFLRKYPTFLYEAQDLMNRLEIMAAPFKEGTADLDVVRETIFATVCSSVRSLGYLYCDARRSSSGMFYQNTIWLYKQLKDPYEEYVKTLVGGATSAKKD